MMALRAQGVKDVGTATVNSSAGTSVRFFALFST
jgi:hypothetical protein